jgi:hypothetical protein
VSTVTQRSGALARSLEVRAARRDARHALLEGRISLGEVLGLECCQTARVYDVLGWQWGWGDYLVCTVMGRVPVGLYRLVGELTDRQRDVLIRECSHGRGRAR